MDLIDITQSPVESPGAYFPQDYYLETLNFLTANGNRMELRKIFRELSYYEDIYTFVVSGYIKIEDSQGFIESLQLTGNEFIEINFGKIKNAPNADDQVFRVYKVGDREGTGNLNTQYYTLYFCSEELLLSEQTKISKSYVGTKISDIVSSILDDAIGVDPNKINVIEETTGLYDFVVPLMKPFEAISWVSTYARPKSTGTIGADMLFFETREGFNFRSLQSMFTDDVYANYKYQQKNLDDKDQPIQEKAMTVLDYEFTKTFDVVNDINSGTFANRLVTIDPLTRSFQQTNFDYDTFKDQAKSLNDNGVTNNLENRLGKALNQAAEGVTKLLAGNANQAQNPYMKSKEGGFAKDIFAETYVPQRTAQLSLSNYNVVKLAIPGDPGISAGKVIEFDLMSIKPTTKERELDRFYSGKYLVTAVRHIIQPLSSSYQTILEIAKDSSPTQFESVDNSDPVWKDGIDS
jgi:hypothetical protein